MPNEVRAAIERAREPWSRNFVPKTRERLALQLKALANKDAVVRMMAEAAHNKTAGLNEPKWDTLTNYSQEVWSKAMRAALLALAKECER